jgi:hypothetical protein
MMLSKKSTITWCEKKYIYSYYIAEFYNCLTGVFLCCSPLLFYYNNAIKSTTFITCISQLNGCFQLLFIVGIGTILFHGTLLYIFQLLDEIPMFLLCIEYYLVLDRLFVTHKYRFEPYEFYEFYEFYKYILCILIIVSGYIYDDLQVVIFQNIITGCVAYLVYQLYHVYNDTLTMIDDLHLKKKDLELKFLYDFSIGKKLFFLKKIIQTILSLKDELNTANKISIFTGVLSIVVWKIDNSYCNHQNFISGHAVWHILTSISLYYVNKIILLCYSIRKHYTMIPLRQ